MINCKICNPSIREEAYCSQHSTSGMVYENKTTMKPNKKEQGGWEKEFDKVFKKYNNSYEKLGYSREGTKYLSYPNNFNVRDIKSFIRPLLLKEYRKGYNTAIKDFKIKNDFGEKSL